MAKGFISKVTGEYYEGDKQPGDIEVPKRGSQFKKPVLTKSGKFNKWETDDTLIPLKDRVNKIIHTLTIIEQIQVFNWISVIRYYLTEPKQPDLDKIKETLEAFDYSKEDAAIKKVFTDIEKIIDSELSNI